MIDGISVTRFGYMQPLLGLSSCACKWTARAAIFFLSP